MRKWCAMFGDELEVGYWVAVPYRWGEQGNDPLAGGWYEVKTLREDEDGDWVIGLGNRRYQWLLKYDTLVGCESDPLGLQPFVYERYEPVISLHPGHQVFLRQTIEGWFDVADYPSVVDEGQGDRIIVSVTIRGLRSFNRGGLALTRDVKRDLDLT